MLRAEPSKCIRCWLNYFSRFRLSKFWVRSGYLVLIITLSAVLCDVNSNFAEAFLVVSAFHRVNLNFITVPGADPNVAIDIRRCLRRPVAVSG